MGGVRFAQQCQLCLGQIGRQVHARNVPLEIDTGACLMNRIDHSARRKAAGRTGLGGRGNSKRRAFDAYMNSAAWRGVDGVREFVLQRDGRACQYCGDEATDAAHEYYPPDIRDTRPEHCKASCSPCNQSERIQRINRRALGERA